jgi:hypothetical protein
MKILPEVGVSIQPMRLRSVDLPLPGWASDREKYSLFDAQGHAVQRWHHLVAESVLLRNIIDADQ